MITINLANTFKTQTTGDGLIIKKPDHYNFDINHAYALHADDYLTLPTPPVSSDEIIHPSILDFNNITGAPWNGYRYWLGATPLPEIEGNSAENPCIYASNDLISFDEPATNPIVPTPPVSYNSDVDLYYNTNDGYLYCIFRGNIEGSGNFSLLYTKSIDGVTWSDPVVIMDSGVQTTGVSPSVVDANDKVRVYYMTFDNYQSPSAHPDAYYLRYREANNLDSAFSDAVECSLDISNSMVPENIGLDANDYWYPWHIELLKAYGRFYLLIYGRAYRYTESNKCIQGLWLAESTDGVNFTMAKTPLMINRDWAAWDRGYYRSTISSFIENGQLKFNLIYSGWASLYETYPVYIGKTTIEQTKYPFINGVINTVRQNEITNALALTNSYLFGDDYSLLSDGVLPGVSASGATYDQRGKNWIIRSGYLYADGPSTEGILTFDIGVLNYEISIDAINNINTIPLNGLDIYLKWTALHSARVGWKGGNSFQIKSVEKRRVYSYFKTADLTNFKVRVIGNNIAFYINNIIVMEYTVSADDFDSEAEFNATMARTIIGFGNSNRDTTAVLNCTVKAL